MFKIDKSRKMENLQDIGRDLPSDLHAITQYYSTFFIQYTITHATIRRMNH